jgi:hypothetical protein
MAARVAFWEGQAGHALTATIELPSPNRGGVLEFGNAPTKPTPTLEKFRWAQGGRPAGRTEGSSWPLTTQGLDICVPQALVACVDGLID